MSCPIVTVIALCYNHERYITDCLNSIQNQTYPNIQLIIVDDHSSDDSVKIITDWINQNKVNCDFIIHKKNHGLCSSINDALNYVRGKFVSIVSTDDCFLPEKIKIQVELFEKCGEEVGVVYSDAYIIDEMGFLQEGMCIGRNRKLYSNAPKNIYNILLKGNFIPAPSAMIRYECFLKVGFYDESLTFEDLDMWLRIARHYKFVYSDTPLVKYRFISDSLSRPRCKERLSDAMYSTYKIYLKNYKFKNLTTRQKKCIMSKLKRYSYELYYLGDIRHSICLIKVLGFQWKIKHLLLVLLAPFPMSIDAKNKVIIYYDYKKDYFKQFVRKAIIARLVF